jgi:hypothetical protein
VISNVLNLLEVSAFVQTFAKGLIVVAVIVATRPRWTLRSRGPAIPPAAPTPGPAVGAAR